MNTVITKTWKYITYIILALWAISFFNFSLNTEAVVSGDLDIIETDGSTIVTEAGDTDTFTISYATEITGDTYYDFSYVPSDPFNQELIVTPDFVTFGSSNWNTPIEITVEAIDDIEVENVEVEAIIFQESGGGGNYTYENNITPQIIGQFGGLDVTINDNDGILIDGYTPDMEIAEGESAILTISLGSEPLLNYVQPRDINLASNNDPIEVVITTPDYENEPLLSDLGSQLSFSPSSLSFVPSFDPNIATLSFDVSQTLTITAADNDDVDGDRMVSTALGIDSAGNNFDILEDIPLSFTVVDNDEAPHDNHNTSRSNKTSSCSDDIIDDGEDNDCDGVVCEESGLGDPLDNDCDGYPNNGDANNDGIIDAGQENVVTTRSEELTFTTKTDSPLRNVQQRTVAKEIDKSSPLLARAGLATGDVISFEVDAAQTNVELLLFTDQITDNEGNPVLVKDLDKSTPLLVNTLKAAKINADTGEAAIIEDAEVSIIVIDGQEVIKITYTAVDGGELDADGITNGTIIDPVGLLYFGEEGVSDNGLIRTGGIASKMQSIISILLLLGVSVAAPIILLKSRK